jgi:hypothetical protein
VETSQFEGKKIALKQTKDGIVMSLAIHPDELPTELIRDFVGSRYMVVMVRLADTEEPMNRGDFEAAQSVKQAGMICRDPKFWEFLHEQGQLFEKNENACVEWLTATLEIQSRADLKTNFDARHTFNALLTEFKEWKR